MLSRSWLVVVVLAISSMLVGGCRTPQSTQHRNSPAENSDAPKIGAQLDPSSERAADAHAHYAAGVVHELDEEPEAALQEYYQAALRDPDNEALILQVSDRLLHRKQYDKVLELLSRAAARPGASGGVYIRLGMVYGQLGKTDQAIAADRIAIKRSPDQLGGYQNLFLSYIQNRQQSDALKVLDAAGRQPEVDADFLVSLSELYASYLQQAPSQKDAVKPRVMAILQRAEKLNPPNPLLKLRLADGYNVLGESDRAAQLYLDLLKKLPDVPFVRERLHSKLAGIYLRSSDRQQAAEQLRAIVRDDPTNPMAWYYLGYLAYEDKKPTDAADCFSKTVMFLPDFEDAYYELALAQISMDKTTDALATLGKARLKFKDRFALEFYTGLAYNRQKDYSEALRAFTAAEVIAKASDPKHLDQDLYFQLGACSERIGDYAQAESYFEKCLQAAPDFAEAQNYLGYMWADRGVKLDKARALIEKAVKSEPKNPAYLDSLGWVLFKLKQPQAALEQVRKAVELSAEPDPTLYDHLGDIYSALQQTDKARDAWNKSLSLEPNEVIIKKLGR